MRKIGIRFFVIFMAIALVLGILEITVRVLWKKIQGPIMPMSLKTHRISANKKLGYELIPGSVAYQDDAWYRINSDGLRDYSYPREKPDSAFRVAAVGDSFTFGMGLELEDSWPKLLEKRLRQIRPEAEVINFGMMGYDSDQEAELVRVKALTYHPDIIVVAYTLNDIGILSRERRELKQYRGYHEFLTTGIGFLDRALMHSRLYLLIKNRFYLLRTKAHLKPPQFSKDGYKAIEMGIANFIKYAYKQKEHLDRLQEAFASIRASARQQIPVVIAIYPDLSDFQEYAYSGEHEIVKSLARSHGLLVLDPLPAFLKQDPANLRISAGNPHPNARGNALFSEVVADFMQANHLIR